MNHPDIAELLTSSLSPAMAAHLVVCPRCRRDRLALHGSGTEPLTLPTEVFSGPRYHLRASLGRGGMGEVYRAADLVLGRELAVKILREDRVDSERAALLEREAQLIAGLQHPGIPPVYELGRLSDGRPYYTMQEASGTSLRHLLVEVGAARPGARWCIERLRRVCDVVAYAHERGVVHRDLKPENVLLGPFDELMVVDWGLGATLDAEPTPGGTLGYSAPEQGQAPPHPSQDVYALGVMLQEVLEGRPPAVPPRALAGAAPASLSDIWARATAQEPSQRPSARQLSDALQSWLEGELRTDEASRRTASALERLEEQQRLLTEATTLRQQADGVLSGLLPSDPLEAKRGAWGLLDRCMELEGRAEEVKLDALDLLKRALELDPSLPAARERLASLYRQELLAAEQRGDTREVRRLVRLLAASGPEHADWLASPALVTLSTSPRAVSVRAERLGTVERRLQPLETLDLGESPLQVRLAPGRWRLVLQDGAETLHLPLVLARGDAPEHALILPNALPGARPVAAGWFWAGGDPAAPDALSARRIWVEGFHIQTFPVTLAQYVAFLNDLPLEDALRWAPAETVGYGDRPRLLLRRSEGDWLPEAEPTDGALWSPDAPVVQIDAACAEAYARWWSDQTGLLWGLPHDLEWEKAARGADARAFPWGDYLDPVFANMVASRAGPPARSVVDAFPADESPYGVRGLGGNVRDWCCNAYQRQGDAASGERLVPSPAPADASYRMVRGGSWTSGEAWCRSAGRFAARPTDRNTSVGFRLVCRSWDILGHAKEPRVDAADRM